MGVLRSGGGKRLRRAKRRPTGALIASPESVDAADGAATGLDARPLMVLARQPSKGVDGSRLVVTRVSREGVDRQPWVASAAPANA